MEIKTADGVAFYVCSLCKAAPELYAALEVMIKDSECYCLDSKENVGRNPCGYCISKAALAKARGEK